MANVPIDVPVSHCKTLLQTELSVDGGAQKTNDNMNTSMHMKTMNMNHHPNDGEYS
jgi:hypothetical protein